MQTKALRAKDAVKNAREFIKLTDERLLYCGLIEQNDTLVDIYFNKSDQV